MSAQPILSTQREQTDYEVFKWDKTDRVWYKGIVEPRAQKSSP